MTLSSVASSGYSQDMKMWEPFADANSGRPSATSSVLSTSLSTRSVSEYRYMPRSLGGRPGRISARTKKRTSARFSRPCAWYRWTDDDAIGSGVISK